MSSEVAAGVLDGSEQRVHDGARGVVDGEQQAKRGPRCSSRRGGCRRVWSSIPAVACARRARGAVAGAPLGLGMPARVRDAPHRGAAEGEAFVLLKQLGEVGVLAPGLARGGEAHDSSRDGSGTALWGPRAAVPWARASAPSSR